jgi:hypothetical protein
MSGQFEAEVTLGNASMFIRNEIQSNRLCDNDFENITSLRNRILIKIFQIYSISVKGKAIPLQAWRSFVVSRRVRLPDFKTNGT